MYIHIEIIHTSLTKGFTNIVTYTGGRHILTKSMRCKNGCKLYQVRMANFFRKLKLYQCLSSLVLVLHLDKVVVFLKGVRWVYVNMGGRGV